MDHNKIVSTVVTVFEFLFWIAVLGFSANLLTLGTIWGYVLVAILFFACAIIPYSSKAYKELNRTLPELSPWEKATKHDFSAHEWKQLQDLTNPPILKNMLWVVPNRVLFIVALFSMGATVLPSIIAALHILYCLGIVAIWPDIKLLRDNVKKYVIGS